MEDFREVKKRDFIHFFYGICTAHFRYQVGLVFNAFVYIRRR